MTIRGPGVTDQPTVDIHRAIPALFGGGKQRGFPVSSACKESACKAGDAGSIPGSGISCGGGNGNPLQHFCLENPMNREAWQAMTHRVAKSRTRLKRLRAAAMKK